MKLHNILKFVNQQNFMIINEFMSINSYKTLALTFQKKFTLK